MDKKTKNIIQYVFWAAVSVALVWFCVKAIDWKDFLEALKLCKWGYVLAAFLVGSIFIVVRGLRWHMLIKPIDPGISVANVVNAYGIGFLANLVLPRAGELVKIGYVVRNSKHSWDAILGTYIVEKGIDALFLGGMTLAFVLGTWGKIGLTFGGHGHLLWYAAAVVILAAAFIVLCYALKSRGGIWGKCWGFISGIGKGLKSFRQMENPGLFLLYTVAIWASCWLVSALIIWSIQDIEPFTSLTLADAFSLTVAGSISTLIPVPGGFGAYHGAVATLIQVLHDIPMGSGMVYATLNHESQVLSQVIMGLIGYINESFFRKK